MKASRSPCVIYSPAVLRSLPDERLAELMRAGSDAAFEVIVARHWGGLVRLCARILGEADAEEAVQETLLRAHAAIVRGDQVVRTLDPWLRTIARNTGLNMLRARGRRPIVPDDEAACLQLTDASAEHRQKFQDVLSAVASLPERQREAIVLREFEGRSYEEIGARLGATDGAVRQLLNRARGALRTRVGPFAGLEPVLRWLISSGGGEGTVRLGALSGGCAITIKICASALPALLMFGPASPTPKRAARARIAANATRERSSSSISQVTSVAPTAAEGARFVFSSVSLRATESRSRASSSRMPAPAVASPASSKPREPAAGPQAGPRSLSPHSPGTPESPRPETSLGIPHGSPAALDHRGSGQPAGTGTSPSGPGLMTSLTEATRRPSGLSQPPPAGISTSSVAAAPPGVGSRSVPPAPRP